LDDFVDVCARQRQPGPKPALNLGKIILAAGCHLSENGVDVLLGGDNNPRTAIADRAEILDDRLC
jgi:hypothetical protein